MFYALLGLNFNYEKKDNVRFSLSVTCKEYSLPTPPLFLMQTQKYEELLITWRLRLEVIFERPSDPKKLYCPTSTPVIQVISR